MKRLGTWCLAAMLSVVPLLATQAPAQEVFDENGQDAQQWYNPADWFDDTPNTWDEEYGYFDDYDPADEGLFEDEIDIGDEGVLGDEEVGFEDDWMSDDGAFESDFYTDDWFESDSEFDEWYDE